MSLLLVFGVAVLSWAVYIELFAIVLLLSLVGALYARLALVESVHYEVVAERDQLRLMVSTMREMSRTHADTVTRLAAIKRKKR